MNERLKKLTGKNPKDFEPVAYHLVNNSDVELFAELVKSEDFLFDFVKQNVAKRLAKVCNGSNYLNLLNFLKYYSPSYEEFIISNLVKYADEDLTDKILEIFENGTEDEKTYCAKYFSYIQDTLALNLLIENAYSENSTLSANCVSTLAQMNDRTIYNKAIEMLESDDEFTQLDGVKLLVSYGDKTAVPLIIALAKKSSFAENIAGELLYLADLFTLFDENFEDAMFITNLVINGLGEILSLSQVCDFQLYNFLEMLCRQPENSALAVVLVNAADKFSTLTENDEYLYDETKDTKCEILEIKKLLSKNDDNKLKTFIDGELKPESLLVYTALDFTHNAEKVRALLSSTNPTVVLKSLETLKRLNSLTDEDKNTALKSVSDENIKNIILAI